MDLSRFFLYSALAVVTYLLLLAWNEDYPRQIAEQDSSPVTSLSSVPDTAVPTTAQSDIPAQVPQAQALTTGNTENPANIDAPQTNPQISQSRLVTISTDTLELSIDLNGGDIVGLALPQYLRQIDVPDEPFVLLESGPGRDYIAQSGLIGVNGIDNTSRARYRTSSSSYRLDPDQDSLSVDLLTTDANGVAVLKRFSFERGSYVIDVTYEVTNTTNSQWQANVFGQIKRSGFDDPSDAGGFSRTFLGFATTSDDDPYNKVEFEDIDDGIAPHDMTGGWIAFSQHYFLTAWIPNQTQRNNFSTRKNIANQYIGGFVSPAFAVAPNTTASQSFRLYAGPTDQNLLAELAPNLNLTIDYGFLFFLAAPIYWLLTHIEPFVHNYGLSIILLTVLVKGIFYKLTETQYKSMAGMRRVMPKMQQLKESYGDDKVKLQKATMELYKKEKINPFGGCLPMLVQMPVFISLYWMLMRSVELRHAPFFLWINDLSVMDPYFVLPLLMGASMFLQMSLSPAPGDPMQAKVMKFMPIMMTLFFLWFPAGLVLYWLVNSVLGILQQWYITRKIEAKYAAKSS
ncbi:MAG: membrane protein insertase YidC [Gammaproteobacteria bacterium]|nr:membrane protein insertase YidC [Gammaproteobacteria bacterium]